jgi:alpha-D-ribose 1-methylphosphonate 5-triphosphate synthase subunit PhnH
MTPNALSGGFANPPIEAAHAFRAALNAMARPGTIELVAGAVPPAPLSLAAGVLILTLIDGTTPVHLAGAHDCPAVRDWIIFQTGAQLVAADQATFAIGSWDALQPVSRFAIGTPDYPDRSATLIVELPTLTQTGARLAGPGIKTDARLSLPGAAAFHANNALYPLGFDTYFTTGASLAALPRSTKVEAA